MALYGGFDVTKHLDELDSPLVSQEGVLTPTVRRERCLANLGLTATAVEINAAADLSARSEILVAATILTAADSGKSLTLSLAAGFEVTLPALAAGLHFRFFQGAIALSGNNHTIVTDSGTGNEISGSIVGAGLVTAYDTVDTLTLVDQKWILGDMLDLSCDGVSWQVFGISATAAAVTGA